jgi:hypothetical protein
MPWPALALVLVAALLHAVWNIAAKKAGGNHHFALISAAGVCVVWAPAAAWFGWHELGQWQWLEWALVSASAVVHVMYFTVLLKGYRVADLTAAAHRGWRRWGRCCCWASGCRPPRRWASWRSAAASS